MKIIGIANTYGPTYICEVTHEELRKFMDAYYSNRTLEPLKVGDKVDLGKGYDFAAKAVDAMQKTQAFVAANQQVVEAILNGLNYQRLQQSAREAATSESPSVAPGTA